MNKETEDKIGQLQLLEQNLQNFAMQKQNFQAQLMEIDNALKELEKAKEPMFKIVGNIMIASDKKSLKESLEEKKKIFDLRLSSIKKQEDSLKGKLKTLQEDVMKELKK